MSFNNQQESFQKSDLYLGKLKESNQIVCKKKINRTPKKIVKKTGFFCNSKLRYKKGD